MHEKLHVQCEVLFGQNPAEGSTGPSQIKRVLRTMWKRPPRNTAHMRQHEKIEKLEAWNRDLPAFWRDFHENRYFLKNYILFDFDWFQHVYILFLSSRIILECISIDSERISEN